MRPSPEVIEWTWRAAYEDMRVLEGRLEVRCSRWLAGFHARFGGRVL